LAQPFNIPQGADMSMFATPKPPVQGMSYQDFRNEIGIRPDMTLPPAQSPQFTSQTAPQGMAEKLESALPNPMDASMEQMKEQQKQAQEKKEEQQDTFNEQLKQRMMGQQDEQSTGA
jgi:hypothetical protein